MIKKLKNLFKIAKLLSTIDSGDLRFGNVSVLGKSQKVLLFSPYGLMHHPPSSSMTLLWSQQGQESNGIGIADDPANRILKNLKEGEVAIGNYLTGDHIVFKEGELVELNVGTKFTINSPDVEINTTKFVLNATDTEINSNKTTVAGTDMEITTTTLTHNGTNISDTHIHPQGSDSDGDTEQDTGGPM